ncbi:MAG: hypothetical protein GX580_07730 [Candidatus Hydrogenedens sp.]|nr:hypothetical protein [Candidatus Hydrogenedentota bacterium]NLF57511.1 hypothetical protein [Candidatus Hydrogenedens sp.]
MRTLLALQQLDTKIAGYRRREKEIPRQKEACNIQRGRLRDELKESEDRVKRLKLEQRECEVDIDQKNAQIGKFESQLLLVKKNEEYKALLHEIDLQRKQISLKEERILGIMMEIDQAQMKFQEDKKRIDGEAARIEEECARIDRELEEAVRGRKALEEERKPLAERVEASLLRKYERIRAVRTPAVVPLNEESCGGCHMTVRAQIVNEIMADKECHACQQCGRLLYYPGNVAEPAECGD